MAQGWPRIDVFEVSLLRSCGNTHADQAFDSALDAGVKLRPTDEERKAIGPAFDKKWQEYYVNAPDKPVMWFGPVSM